MGSPSPTLRNENLCQPNDCNPINGLVATHKPHSHCASTEHLSANPANQLKKSLCTHQICKSICVHQCHTHSPAPIPLVNMQCTCQKSLGNSPAASVCRDGGCTDSSGVDSRVNFNKNLDEICEISTLPPALPPRPLTRPRDGSYDVCGGGIDNCPNGINSESCPMHYPFYRSRRNYLFWCAVCGGSSTIIGVSFLAAHFMLRSYTSTLNYFETIPTYVPAFMLMLTGLCILTLTRRKYEFNYLLYLQIKISGIFCLLCALICVLVTITTTVIHMNRLQTLRECVYTQRTRTCMCFSVLLNGQEEANEGNKYIFESTPDCEVIHGALYSCLRLIFGLSVTGILTCIFSCMLIYQLLSHERKKMYWEQLEMRCRTIYQQPPLSTTNSVTSGTMHSLMQPVSRPPTERPCTCCEECRYTTVPPNTNYPWNAASPLERFWVPGRVSNFYSPNPGEELGPNQFPNASHMEPNNRTRSSSGWNWRRLTWSRSQSITTPDSQYGFNMPTDANVSTIADQIPGTSGSGAGYTILERPCVDGSHSGSATYLWGPPPPYSDPNSPARINAMVHNSRFVHVHNHVHNHPITSDRHGTSTCLQHGTDRSHETRSCLARHQNYNDASDTTLTQSSTSCTNSTKCTDSDSRISNTLPTRKTKKRLDISSIKPGTNTSSHLVRKNVQNVFPYPSESSTSGQCSDEQSYHESTASHNHTNHKSQSNGRNAEQVSQQFRFLPRLQGVENPAFQNNAEKNGQKQNFNKKPTTSETSESEMYFADVSSCNISVRNEGRDSSLYDDANENEVKKGGKLTSLCVNKISNNAEEDSPKTKYVDENYENHSNNLEEVNGGLPTSDQEEDYLSHFIGKRSMSTRSRIPIPALNESNYEDVKMHLLEKEISQNSLCNSSTLQSPMTETTDDAVTPGSGKNCCFYDDNQGSHFQNSLRFFQNKMTDNEYLAPDAQYEEIKDVKDDNEFSRQRCFNDEMTRSDLKESRSAPVNYPGATNHRQPNCSFEQNENIILNRCNLASTISCLSKQNIDSFENNVETHAKVKPSPNQRRKPNVNISTIIQNMGSAPPPLYKSSEEEENQDSLRTQGGNHSDATMDSGWQSGTEHLDYNKSTNI